jgi:hypothetical protein
MPHISPGDVGKFIVASFLHLERFAGKEIELGSENITIGEVAATITRVSGVDVGIKRRSAEEIEEAAKTILTQQFQIMAIENDMAIDPDSLSQYGIELTSFEEYLRTEKEALMQGLGLDNVIPMQETRM